MAHTHHCADCGADLYACQEPIQIDDGGRWCANAPVGDREYCDDCRVATADDADELFDATIGGVR